ncbi:unnamed protein product [Prorocentrum cordatum]|uniref:Vacuolar protein 14 C-terminal Fig4-binding domain-containing protein n=1 Tax=Prorocentrum cordatum TaxID=2364126 RepID=A0ABN9S1A2_9DINO|nr:unnamed protein product [Polarella glacialis]
MDDRHALSAIRSGLADRSAERRKQAQEQLERHVRDLAQELDAAAPGAPRDARDGAVEATLRTLRDEFCASPFPEKRKTGLRCLAAAAVALGPRHARAWTETLVPVVLTRFSDEDPGVRYGACESFYNIAKVVRGAILVREGAEASALGYLRDTFDGLCRLYCDVDANVKDGAQCLDRLVRDIVTECRDFNYPEFIPLLTTRIRVLNPSVRQLVLGWMLLLDSVPQVDMIEYLPQYLEGLFGILTSDNREIRNTAEGCLTELLAEIKSRTSDDTSEPRARAIRHRGAQRAIAQAAPTIAKCCRGGGERRQEDNYMRLRALHWLLELVRMQTSLEQEPGAPADPAPAAEDAQRPLHAREPHGARPAGVFHFGHARAFSAGLLAEPPPGGATSPALPPGGDDAGGGLSALLPVLLSGALHCLDDAEDEIRDEAEQANTALRAAASCLERRLPVEAVADAVLGAMRRGEGGQERSPAVLLKCFSWAQLLLRQAPGRVLQPAVRDRLLEAALAVLGCPEEEEEEEAKEDAERRAAKEAAEGAAGERVAAVALQLIASLVAPSAQPQASEGQLHMTPLPSVASDDDVACATQPEARLSPEQHHLGAAPDGCPGEGGSEQQRRPSGDGDFAGGGGGAAAEAAASAREAAGEGPAASLFARMCHRLFALMKEDRRVLGSRGALIVRQLCEGVSADRFYAIAARAVVAEQDPEFAQQLVRVLNRVLLTSRETRALRARLRDAAAAAPRPSALQLQGGGEPGQQAPVLPLELLRSWRCCQACALGLCLWLHWFELAAEVTAGLARSGLAPCLAAQLAELAGLLESPVFVRVRLELLDTRRHPALLRAVLGLVSLLPQEKTLRRRLDLVTTGILLDRLGPGGGGPPAPARVPGAAVAARLAEFEEVVELHRWRDCTM